MPTVTDLTIPDAAKRYLSLLLVPNEVVIASAVQRRMFALTHRRTLAIVTSSRFIGIKRGIVGGFSYQDADWCNIGEAQIDVGIFSAAVIVSFYTRYDNFFSSDDFLIDDETWPTGAIRLSGLRIEEAHLVYKFCEQQEQIWCEKRRIEKSDRKNKKKSTELPNLTAASTNSGGINITMSNASPTPQQVQLESPDATARLQSAKEMLDKGLITEAEYATIKERVLNSI